MFFYNSLNNISAANAAAHDTTATISRLFLLYANKRPVAVPAMPGIITSVE